jgi:hypothetical protein
MNDGVMTLPSETTVEQLHSCPHPRRLGLTLGHELEQLGG